MKPRVLIVNDDEAITQQLFWTLCEEYDVVTANNLQSAVRRATIYEPDVSILDLQMPKAIDSPEIGLPIIEYIKAHLPKSKILVMTPMNLIEKIKAYYEVGVDEYLGKPFDTARLLSTLRRLTAARLLEVI